MGISILVNGRIIYVGDEESCSYVMEHSLKAISIKGCLSRADTSLQLGIFMMGNLRMVRLMGKDSTFGLMENITMGIGRWTREKARGYLSLLMDVNT